MAQKISANSMGILISLGSCNLCFVQNAIFGCSINQDTYDLGVPSQLSKLVFFSLRGPTPVLKVFVERGKETNNLMFFTSLGQHEVFRCSCSWQDVWLKSKICAFWFIAGSLFASLSYPESFCKFHNTNTSCCFFAVISYSCQCCMLLFGLLDTKMKFLEFFYEFLIFSYFSDFIG